MFTGIIETIGKVKRIVVDEGNTHFLIESSIGSALYPEQSVSHNGVCLTVTKAGEKGHWATAVAETLRKSNLGGLQEGDRVNLERSMRADGRFEGHIVQGHIDGTARCMSIAGDSGSSLFVFSMQEHSPLIVEKGSIAVNGISLTCFNIKPGEFSVAIIPFTQAHTNMGDLKVGDVVNLEYDLVGKYLARLSKA